MKRYQNLFKACSAMCIGALLIATLPVASWAQDWVTPEVCNVSAQDLAQATKYLEQSKKEAAQANHIANGTGRFWQVTSPSGAVSHLWGAMHSNQRIALDLPKQMQKTLHAARVLSVEIDYRHKDRTSLEAANAFEGWWQDTLLPPEPIPISSDADPRIEGWIMDRIIAKGIDPTYVSYMTPGGVLSILLSDPCEDFTGGTIPNQDNFIKTLAHIDGIPIIGLESSTQTFFDLNQPQNRHFAEAIITSYGAYQMPREDGIGHAMSMSLYARGEIGQMMMYDQAYLTEMLGPDAENIIALRNAFLIEHRNDAFLEVALGDFEAGGMFMAVGAFHLPGEHGLVALLRAKGFDVERIDVESEHEQRY